MGHPTESSKRTLRHLADARATRDAALAAMRRGPDPDPWAACQEKLANLEVQREQTLELMKTLQGQHDLWLQKGRERALELKAYAEALCKAEAIIAKYEPREAEAKEWLSR